MTRILISDRTHPILEERLCQAGYDVSVEPDHDYQSLIAAAQGCAGLVVRSKVNIDRADKWTVRTADSSLSAHYEHMVLITDKEPEILTWQKTM